METPACGVGKEPQPSGTVGPLPSHEIACTYAGLSAADLDRAHTACLSSTTHHFVWQCVKNTPNWGYLWGRPPHRAHNTHTKQDRCMCTPGVLFFPSNMPPMFIQSLYMRQQTLLCCFSCPSRWYPYKRSLPKRYLTIEVYSACRVVPIKARLFYGLWSQQTHENTSQCPVGRKRSCALRASRATCWSIISFKTTSSQPSEGPEMGSFLICGGDEWMAADLLLHISPNTGGIFFFVRGPDPFSSSMHIYISKPTKILHSFLSFSIFTWSKL